MNSISFFIKIFNFFFAVCSNITVTEHVLLSCQNDSNNINCTISCEDGYAFDHSVKPFYVCGESTYYLWDFKTLDNPNGKLPQCTGTYYNGCIVLKSRFYDC